MIIFNNVYNNNNKIQSRNKINTINKSSVRRPRRAKKIKITKNNKEFLRTLGFTI